MKILEKYGILFLVLLLSLFFCISVFAAESGEVNDESVPSGFAISYGYRPLQDYAGNKASKYITGTTPATVYVPAGGSHKVAACSYTFRDYIFAGWSCGGTVYQPGEVIYNVQSSMHLTAEWARCSVSDTTVIGILSYGGDKGESVAVGSTVTLKDGKWQDEQGRIFSGGSSFLMSFSTVKFKSYSADNASVKISYNGNGVTDGVQCAFQVEEGDSFKVDNCFAVRDGYSFIGWKDETGKFYAAGDTCTASADKTLTAQWQEADKPAPNYCSVNLLAGKGGSISPEGKTSVAKGESLEFTVTPDRGYELASVTCDGAELGTGGSYVKTVNADMEIRATFTFVGIEETDEPSSEREQYIESEEEEISVIAEESENASQASDDKGEDKDERSLIIILLCALFLVIGGWFVAFSMLKKKKHKKHKKHK